MDTEYSSATVVGGGVIGISWAGLFLAHGLRVTISDPEPDIEPLVRTGLAEVAPTLSALGLPTADLTDGTDALRFERDIARAVADADVVQENGPERADVKQQLWAQIEDAAPPEALFASSSSGIPATTIAEGMRQPGRLLIGHPFNPPHLIPLVEIVPGTQTDPAV